MFPRIAGVFGAWAGQAFEAQAFLPSADFLEGLREFDALIGADGLVPWADLRGPVGDRHERSGPDVPAQWSADLEYLGIFGQASAMATGQGTFLYDRTGRRNRMTYLASVSYFTPNHTYSQDTLTITRPDGTASSNQTTDSGENGVCMPGFVNNGTPYEDPFSWMRQADPVGSKDVQGVKCTIYKQSKQTPRLRFEIAVCVDTDGLPREYNQSGGFGAFSMTNVMRLSNFKLADPGDDAFKVTDGCSKYYPRPPCPDSRVGPIDVYRVFGPPEPQELDDRNTGDVLGDLAFICTQGASDEYTKKVITHWKVNVSYAFGQYSLCNFNGKRNFCTGPDAQRQTVGRRSGQGQGRGQAGGQCTENPDVGSQYSFPSEAKCPPGISPGADTGCAWGGAVPLRTVPASCIMKDHGLLEACKREIGHAPFTQSAAIWAAAFASDDPLKGGCPDASPGVPIVV